MGGKGGILRRHGDLVGALQRVADGVCIAAAHVLSALAAGVTWREDMTSASAIAVILFGLIGAMTGLYRPWRSERISSELKQVVFTWAVVGGLLVVLSAMLKTTAQYSRVVTFGWFLTSLGLIGGLRIAVRTLLRELRARGRNLRKVAIFGMTRGGEQLCRSIADRPWLGMDVVNIYDDSNTERTHTFEANYAPFAGGLAELVAAARSGQLDIIYVALPMREEERVSEILRALADTTATVYLATDFFTYDLLHGQWSMLGQMPVVSVYDSPFHGPAGWLKRVEDVLVGALIVALISIPLLVVSLLIKLTSKGPVFFRQRRYGLNGKEIRVLKFRTMTVCEDGPTIKQATKNDARVTRLGRFLRRTSIDELPQFLQVITGEMSIVGPRPHAVAHNEEYRALIHGYMLRHKVKPGITGWAQVNGWRGETDDIRKMEKRVEHDLEYIKNWNLFWDLKIIGMTVVGSKKAENAY